MPGISKLNDYELIKTFQVMDKVIQDNNPLFILVWAGSVFFFIAAVIFSFISTDVSYSFHLLILFIIYFAGVQLPTIIINIPLNNKLQSINVDKLTEADLVNERKEFERKWKRSNIFRTIIASITSLSLLVVLFMV